MIKMSFILILICFTLVGCQSNLNSNYHNNAVKDYSNSSSLNEQMDEVTIQIQDMAKGRVSFETGGQKLLNSKSCSLSAPDTVRTLCTIGALSAFEAHQKHLNGLAYYALVNMKIDSEIRNIQAGADARDKEIARAQATQNIIQLLKPQGGGTSEHPSWPTQSHTTCAPNGSQVWCNTTQY